MEEEDRSEDLLIGTRGADAAQKWLTDNVKKAGEWYKAASADQAGIGDDILRILGGGAKNVGKASRLPGIKHGLAALAYAGDIGGKAGANIAETVGVDRRIGGVLGSFGADAMLGFGIGKVARIGKYTRQLSQVDDITRGLLIGNRPVGAAGMAKNTLRTNLNIATKQVGLETVEDLKNVTQINRAQRLAAKAAKSKELKAIRATDEGTRFAEDGIAWMNREGGDGTLKGFMNTIDEPLLDNSGNVIILRPDQKGGVKFARLVDRKGSSSKRAVHELRMTPFEKQTWTQTLGDGFIDHKKIKGIDQHHKHMIEGYDWAFTGLNRSEGMRLSQMALEDGHALGRVNWNKLNIPKPVHDTLHAWMDDAMGLNGVDMPSLKGMDLNKRYEHLKVYMEHIQPAMDEAVFELMNRYNNGQPLLKKGVSMANQFIDANRYKRKAYQVKKNSKIAFSEQIQRHIDRSVEIGVTEPNWKVGSVEYTWRPQTKTGQIDIPPQNRLGFKGLRDDFFNQINDLPPGSVWELNPKYKDSKRRRIYDKLFKDDPRITRSEDETLGWVLTIPS